MNLTTVKRIAHHVPTATVFGVAAWQSYWHTVEVATHYGEADTAYVMTFSVDGLMVVAARYMAHAKTTLGRWLAGASFLVGVVVTFGINILAADPNPVSRTLAAVPAVAMVGVAAMLHWSPQAVKPVRKATRRAAPRNVTPIKGRAKAV